MLSRTRHSTQNVSRLSPQLHESITLQSADYIGPYFTDLRWIYHEMVIYKPPSSHWIPLTFQQAGPFSSLSFLTWSNRAYLWSQTGRTYPGHPKQSPSWSKCTLACHGGSSTDYWSSVDFRTRLFPNYELQSISFSSTLHPQNSNEGSTQASFPQSVYIPHRILQLMKACTMYRFAKTISVLLQLVFPGMPR